jgi:hypothetical protein
VKAQLVPLALLVTLGLDGLILLGKFDGGVEALAAAGPLKVTINLQVDRP